LSKLGKKTSEVFLAALFLCGVAAEARAQDPIHWSLAVTSKGPVLPGKPFEASLNAKIDQGWHLYTLDEPAGGPSPTVITLPASKLFAAAGQISAPPGTRLMDPNFNLETEFFEDQVAFLIPLKVVAATPNGRHKLEVTVNWQTCNDRICLPPTEATIAVDVGVGATETNAPLAATTAATVGATGPLGTKGTTGTTGPTSTATVAAPNAAKASGGATTPVAPAAPPAPVGKVLDLAADSQASTLAAYIGLAALMGALSLITPCVFPMVPITVSYFTNRARKSRREAVMQALVYGAGIVLTFTGVGFTLALAYGASGLNRFAANPWLNLGVTAMFLAFALSLFGVWELALPSKLVNAASRADSGKGRLAGTLLMGLAFTLTSFTCTAPFLGTLLVVASQGDWQWPLAGMLAFSSVFALPFVILAFVPQVLASLPRSGPWLVAVKAVMGIIEIAAAMKFLSNADLVWNWNIFTRPVVLTSWVLLSIVLVVYLAGLVRLGPVPRLKRPGIGRMVAVAAAVALGIWLGTGLAGNRLGELEAFLPPADLAVLSPKGELPWILNDYDKALAQAKQNNQRILIDFTGYTCTNCRWMEANMFPAPEISRELARYVRVRLYTDGRGEPYQSFQKMEQKLFGTVALPYYAVMSPDGTPIVGFGGLTRDQAQYQSFLRKGLE
jgi:thiol:disulfide interchange protein